MTPESIIYCVIANDISEDTGCAVEFFYALGFDFSTWKDEETQKVHYTIYCSDYDNSVQVRDQLVALQPEWHTYGVDLDDIRLGEIKKEDWAESWKIHFKTMVISPRIVVRPSWEEYDPQPGQSVIVLDPGMSFGTGQHATTKSCIAAIDAHTANAVEPLSFLDAGCGSGILSIAAYKLGCRPVCAFDIDPDVIPIAKENAGINGIPADEYETAVAALLDYPNTRRFDIVAANILSSALIEGREHLVSLVKPDSILILAGILTTEYPTVRKAFEELGCVELSNSTEREWTGGVFRTPPAKN